MGLENNQCKHLKVPNVDIYEGLDKLKLMLKKQASINEMFMPASLPSQEEKRDWTIRMKLAMDGEIAELMEAVEFKWWKQRKGIDELELKYEIIDILHFLLSLMLIWGMDENEIFGLYLAKAEENINRQRRGY